MRSGGSWSDGYVKANTCVWSGSGQETKPAYLIRFAPVGLVASLPRMTVTEALGSVKVVFMLAVTLDFLGGPSGSALPPSRLGCHWYCSLPNEITSTVPPKDRSESVAASWNMMCTGYDCSWSLLMTSRDH